MWKFCSQFSSFAMAWYIMNSCHKVVRSIKYITLKLCADCAKQFVRNAQNCGKSNHGFCTMITHQLTQRRLCLSFWPKTKPQLPYSPDLAFIDFFLLPKLKTLMKGKRFATIEETKSKSKQELLAIPKRSFQKCFEDWKKRLHMSVTSEGGYFEGDKIVIDKSMNTLGKNFK